MCDDGIQEGPGKLKLKKELDWEDKGRREAQVQPIIGCTQHEGAQTPNISLLKAAEPEQGICVLPAPCLTSVL